MTRYYGPCHACRRRCRVRRYQIKLTMAMIVLLAGTSQIVRGDKVTLRSGRDLEGKVSEEANIVTLRMVDNVVVTVPRARIRSIEKGACLLDEYATRRQSIASPDVQQLVDLAKWCEKNGLREGRRTSLLEILKQDPNHAFGRQSLGYLRFEDAWYQPDALESVSRRPLLPAQQTAAEAKLESWLTGTAKPGLHITSTPAGLPVHVVDRKETDGKAFAVNDVKYLRGRTPLSMQLPAGRYVVAIERTTATDVEFVPESMGFYHFAAEHGTVHAPVFEVTLTKDEPQIVVGLFSPESTGRSAAPAVHSSTKERFPIDESLFQRWVTRCQLPASKRQSALSSLRRNGKVLYLKGKTVHILQYAGKGQLFYSTLHRK